MNSSTFEKLQYNELKEEIKTFCVSDLGKELLNKLQPSSNETAVRNRLKETTEARTLIDTESHIPLMGIANIAFIIDKLDKGMILEPGELVAVGDFLRGCRRIKAFMRDKEFFAPTLSSYAHSMTELQSIEEEITFSIKNNVVSSEASKELKRIRRLMKTTEEKIEEKLNKFMKSSSNKEYIQEFFISKKNDRFTVPIKASYKNQVAGSIIEVSSKGATVFIEPQAIGKYSAELAVLKAEEAVEEYQILAALTGTILEKIQEIRINLELIAQYDMIFAKGKFSKSINGKNPAINTHGFIKLVKTKHPLLPENAIPLDFEIGEDYRSLIITGPNAGGKTVVLKTIGLVTLAIMSGFHITCEEGTEIAIFDNLFVDIGDNQSLENALSTFSSHMKNIADIMAHANKKTLLLFDEIGSGTEPNEGSALAIAILEEFYHLGCITVATTHYGEIKRYSEIHNDFMNAAMAFNSETVEPLYRLIIGKSGDSNALWIANRMNIRERVLTKARAYMEKKDYNLELVDESKIIKPAKIEVKKEAAEQYNIGDKVMLLDLNDFGIVYKEKDAYNNITVFYKNEFIEVNEKRIKLEIKATELYPENYDLNQIFISFEERKWQKDMERGSKKALRKVEKEIRNSKK